MSTTFPRTRKSRLGYDIDQVEDFLEEARQAYTADGTSANVLTAAGIRTVAFAMQKGGYITGQVDAALERLEDAFAARERELGLARGEQAWYAGVRSAAQEIIDRLSRPSGQKFTRSSIFTEGYDTKSVDVFAERLIDYFRNSKTLKVEQVRTVTFRSSRRGYSEAQVDFLLDTVVDVMLSVQ